MRYTYVTEPPEILVDNGNMALTGAPQGGHVLMVSARIRGLESATIELRARLRDAVTGAIVAEETRTVAVVPLAGQPDWSETDRHNDSHSSHVPACPDYDKKDIVDQPYVLEVSVLELYADYSEGRATLTIVPRCDQTDEAELERCKCECEARYTLGKCGGFF